MKCISQNALSLMNFDVGLQQGLGVAGDGDRQTRGQRHRDPRLPSHDGPPASGTGWCMYVLLESVEVAVQYVHGVVEEEEEEEEEEEVVVMVGDRR
ncbi:unnamed protein product [Arctogadus glacialis]